MIFEFAAFILLPNFEIRHPNFTKESQIKIHLDSYAPAYQIRVMQVNFSAQVFFLRIVFILGQNLQHFSKVISLTYSEFTLKRLFRYIDRV